MLSKLLTIIGLAFDALGVFLLLRNEILTRRRDKAESELPEDYLTKYLDADLTDTPIRKNTLQEEAYEKASKAIPSRKALFFTKVGLAFILFGFILQIVETILS